MRRLFDPTLAERHSLVPEAPRARLRWFGLLVLALLLSLVGWSGWRFLTRTPRADGHDIFVPPGR